MYECGMNHSCVIAAVWMRLSAWFVRVWREVVWLVRDITPSYVMWIVHGCGKNYLVHDYSSMIEVFGRLRIDVLWFCASYVPWRICAWYESFMSWILHIWYESFMWLNVTSLICVVWLIYVCDVTHLRAWYNSFLRATWLIHVCGWTHPYVWNDHTYICRCLKWPYIYMSLFDATHSSVRHDLFLCVPWIISPCDVIDLFIYVSSYVDDVTLLLHSDDSFIWMSMNESCHTMSHVTQWVTSHIRTSSRQAVTTYSYECVWMSHVTQWVISQVWASHVTCMMTHSYMGHDSFIHGTWIIHTWDILIHTFF